MHARQKIAHVVSAKSGPNTILRFRPLSDTFRVAAQSNTEFQVHYERHRDECAAIPNAKLK
jgi:hypothetical protein